METKLITEDLKRCKKCIPYDGNEHLLGTHKNPGE